MDEVEFDQIIARAGNPNLIPGIYNYCDRRCERCPFTERCFQFLETRRERAQVRDEHENGDESVGRAVARSLERSLDMLRIIGRRLGVDLGVDAPESAEPAAGLDANQRPGVSQIIQEPEVQDAQPEQEQEQEEDALVRLAREYSDTAWPILRALGPVLHMRGEAALIDARETLEVFSTSISAKVFRAVVTDADPALDPEDLQNDANGSAKVARLMIQDSRRAWRALMVPGRATEDGVPARLVRMLDDLDIRLGARFPRAMDFQRPGFDTDLSDAGVGVCSPGCRAPTPSSTGEKHAALLERSSS
ncbi:MAG: hypothetical protein ACM4AI_03445 [Acidobacteriota bacterium]